MPQTPSPEPTADMPAPGTPIDTLDVNVGPVPGGPPIAPTGYPAPFVAMSIATITGAGAVLSDKRVR